MFFLVLYFNLLLSFQLALHRDGMFIFNFVSCVLLTLCVLFFSFSAIKTELTTWQHTTADNSTGRWRIPNLRV